MRIAAPALSLVCVLLSAVAAQADRRVAFVLGNGDYRTVMPLPNPTIDSTAMAAKLRNIGFEVVEGTDLTREGMTAKLIEFGRKAQGADIAVFFYAGHGIAVNGVNYLLPVDADLKSEMDVKLGAAIDVDTTLDQTMGDAKVKLVFLDACRDNPFAERIRSASRTRSVTVANGLAEMKSGEGTLIAFATGPGQTALDGSAGGHSPFTRALLDNIATPGVEIQQAMTKVRAQVNESTRKQQLPWGHTNLIGAVYLNPAADGAAATPVALGAAPATAAAAPVTSEVELEFWRSIRDSNKVEELDAYLTNYPNGQFRSIALARIASLKAAPPKPEKALPPGVDPAVTTAEATQLTEDRLGLKPSQRRDVQRRLSGLGFDVSTTGTFGPETRGVIRRWQAARGYVESGFLNGPQHKALLAEAQPVEEKPVVRQAAPRPRVEQPAGQMQPAGRQQSSPFDGAAGAFIGGVIGGALRR